MKLSLLYEKAKDPSRKSKFQAALKRTGHSQNEIADKLGIDPSTVSRDKSGTRDPSCELMRDYAKVGIDACSVFDLKSKSDASVTKSHTMRSKRHSGRKPSDKARRASKVARDAAKIGAA